MRCQTCSYEIPNGTVFCPNCGRPVTGASSPNQGIAPTVYAAPPVPPTVAAPQDITPPPASYYTPQPSYSEAPPVYGAPQPNYGGTPPVYGAPPPAPYGVQQQSPYGAPPPAPYGTPQQAPYGAPPPMAPYGVPTYVQPQRSNNRGPVIAIVTVLIIAALVVGGFITANALGGNKGGNTAANSTSTVTSNTTSTVPTTTNGVTPTVSSGGGAPTTSQIDANATTKITSAVSTSTVDPNTQQATGPTSSFNVPATMYIAITFPATTAGYAMVKLYRDGSFDVSSQVLTVQADYAYGSFSFDINNPGQFVAGVYWCAQSSCSDAALARVVNFSAA